MSVRGRLGMAVGYVRVSTIEQAVHGLSVDTQTEKIREYCRTYDLTLCGVYGDPGISGASIRRRPGLLAVLHMARKKRVGHVVVCKLDRLARNTVETLEVAEVLEKVEVGLHSITERLDTKSAMGRFFFVLMASLAEMERGVIGERTRAVLEAKRRRGEYVGGNPPTGFRARKVKTPEGGVLQVLEEDETEKELAALAKAYRKQRWSWERIAARFNVEERPRRNGERWHVMAIKRLVEGGKRAGGVTLPAAGSLGGGEAEPEETSLDRWDRIDYENRVAGDGLAP